MLRLRLRQVQQVQGRRLPPPLAGSPAVYLQPQHPTASRLLQACLERLLAWSRRAGHQPAGLSGNCQDCRGGRRGAGREHAPVYIDVSCPLPLISTAVPAGVRPSIALQCQNWISVFVIFSVSVRSGP
jgi:hypothetical protein